jgi:3-methyladenine DNA glycosylase/8-oxoguanine DNA glycosylase
MPAIIEPATAVRHLAAADPVIARIIEMGGPFGMREDGDNPFRSLARAIVFQQLSGKAADTIYNRFLALFGQDPGDGPTTLVRRTSPDWDGAAQPFPEPAAVLALDHETLRAAGLSRQKVAAIRDLSLHFAEGRLSTHLLHEWEDEAVIEHLTQVRGVGRWTAEMFLMFHLRRADVLPVNDVGINRAIKRQYGLDVMPKPDQVRTIGRPWSPWSTVACWYLWRSEAVTLLT